MLVASPLPLDFVSRIVIKFSPENKCAETFMRNYIPLMSYGNPHLKFSKFCLDDDQEYCKVFLKNGSVHEFGFGEYPQDVMQKILDLEAENG